MVALTRHYSHILQPYSSTTPAQVQENTEQTPATKPQKVCRNFRDQGLRLSSPRASSPQQYRVGVN